MQCYYSAKKVETNTDFLEFNDVEPLKILKHCSNRWLSLQKCVLRLLHHWSASLSYRLQVLYGQQYLV